MALTLSLLILAALATIVSSDSSCVSETYELQFGKTLKFTSTTNEVYYIPTDNDYLDKFSGYYTFTHSKKHQRKVSYLRSKEDIIDRGKLGNCTSTMDVLSWLMGVVNQKQKLLLMAYGQLIHIHREKEFVNEKGDYFDDDIDMWASLETILLVADVERDLFFRFGWTVRSFVLIANADGEVQNEVIFLQLVATCGHDPIDIHLKANATERAIEIYPFPLVYVNDGKDRVFKDLWHGTKFSESLIYPPKCIEFTSILTTYPLSLQLPNDALSVMDCLYGTWKVPMKRHAKINTTCVDNSEANNPIF